MKANVFTCPELIEQTYENIGARSHLNAYVNVRNQDEALKEAEESQKRIEKSKSETKLSANVVMLAKWWTNSCMRRSFQLSNCCIFR